MFCFEELPHSFLGVYDPCCPSVFAPGAATYKKPQNVFLLYIAYIKPLNKNRHFYYKTCSHMECLRFFFFLAVKNKVYCTSVHFAFLRSDFHDGTFAVCVAVRVLIGDP